MPLVNAKCTNCGANLNIDNSKEAAICDHCGSAFIVEKAIQNYNITNNNNVYANVVNLYNYNDNNDNKKSIEQYIKIISTTKHNRLLSPTLLLDIMKTAISNKNTTEGMKLFSLVNNYCDNLDFSFDSCFSYCGGIYEFENLDKLWIDAGNPGNDGSYFIEWIRFDTKELTLENKTLALTKIQNELTLYYIYLLCNGKTSADCKYDIDCSSVDPKVVLWGVTQTSKKEFTNIEEKINNKFLLPYFYEGIKNANKLNNLRLGYNKDIFILGKYALYEKYDTEYHDYSLDNLYNFSHTQQDIDGIMPINRESYLSELNSLLDSCDTSMILSHFNIYNRKTKDGEDKYRITSVNEEGMNVEYLFIPKKHLYSSEWRYYKTIPVDDIRELLIIYRKSANKCSYCGSEFKGLLNKVCFKCGKPKDY